MLKKGFTLIEMLVAVTLFSVVGLITVQTFYSTFKFQQRTSLEVGLVEEAKFIVDAISREIEAGNIDYDEYFNQCVINNTCPLVGNDLSAGGSDNLGENHGAYAWQFFDGGYKSAAEDPSDRDSVGLLCQKPDGFGGFELARFPDEDCVSSSLSFSEDENTGVFRGGNSSSVCSASYYPYVSLDPSLSYNELAGNGSCVATQSNAFGELYLINDSGTRKTILGKELVSDSDPSFVLSKLVLTSQSITQGDAILFEEFSCELGFNCTGNLGAAKRNDLYEFTSGENVLDDFVPISPLQVSVKNLFFIIDPLEDPARAFNEISTSVQKAPRVTIVLELEKSPRFELPFLSESYNLTLQKTVLANSL